MRLALPLRPPIHSGEASCLGKIAGGLVWPGLGNGLAIVPQEKHESHGQVTSITAIRASCTEGPRLSLSNPALCSQFMWQEKCEHGFGRTADQSTIITTGQ
ncbi:unnamed protein product [Pleuronectes platessa]|uniref:Uncharacterized protein n=1 Tax=Pleuronectes platessa TaxID=8262 RepID=A0A9N7YDM6_PLEPL|nr:unnamed protein product [Pleuronectes platessa]